MDIGVIGEEVSERGEWAEGTRKFFDKFRG